jgi:hypothetical protein
MYHLKNEGTGVGRIRTNVMFGEIFYLTGGSKLFFATKAIHRIIFGRPIIIGGVAMVLGYLRSLVSGKQLLVTRDEAVFYKSILNRRLLNTILNMPFFKPLNSGRVGLS